MQLMDCIIEESCIRRTPEQNLSPNHGQSKLPRDEPTFGKNRMLRRRAEHTLIRVLSIYAAGLCAGMQIALYLFDVYDDGTADIRSLLIGLVFFALGLFFALWRFLKRTE